MLYNWINPSLAEHGFKRNTFGASMGTRIGSNIVAGVTAFRP